MSIISIIKEEIQNIIDGVGDRYAEKAFRIPDTEQRDYIRQTQPAVRNDPANGEMVGYAMYKNNRKLSPIYKNPTSLQNFEQNIRAISDKNNDLYVAMIDGEFIHVDMENVFPSGFNAWDTEVNMLWHRVKNTNNFGFSDSMFNQNSGTDEEIQNRINLLKQKHPQFDFAPIYYETWWKTKLQYET